MKKIKQFLALLTAAFTLSLLVACEDFFKTEETLDMEERQQEIYEMYKEAKGSEALNYDEWIASIAGKDGVGITSIDAVKQEGKTTITVTLDDGTTKVFTIEDGVDGTNGIDGVGIDDIETITANGITTIIISLTDGTSKSFDVISGANGVNGNGIKNIETSEGENATILTITLDDGTTKEIVLHNGSNGTNGVDGIGIDTITSSKEGGVTTVTIKLTDGTSQTFTLVDGEDGSNGTNGNGIKDITTTTTEETTKLVITLDDGTAKEILLYNGIDGKDGIGIESVVSTKNGTVTTVTVTLTNKEKTTFEINDGANGIDGIGIKNIELTETFGNKDTYTITLTDNTQYTFTIENYREDYSGVSSIALPDGCLYINQYEIVKANLSYIGNNFNEQLLKWSSSSDAVVVANGALIAVEPGYAEITATYGELVATCSVIVIEKTNSNFTLTNKKIMLEVEETRKLNVLLNNTSYDYVNWTSMNNQILAVNDGLVTALSAGVTKVIANVHGNILECEVVVRGVDGNLDEWIDNGTDLYRKVVISDLYHPERRAVTYARVTDKGLFVGGYAYHQTYSHNQELWYYNTNFELVLEQNGGIVKYYASEGFISSGCESTIQTILNPNSTSAFDVYLTTYELFVPVEVVEGCVKMGFAFRTINEKITHIVGNESNLVETTDWWWNDLHHPHSIDEFYYVYEDGISGGAKHE